MLEEKCISIISMDVQPGGPVENWRKILDLNVHALSICTKEAIQSMKEHKITDGHIVHINSVLGHCIPPESDITVPMYTASKHAVKTLTEGLCSELAKAKSKIRITSVSPGMAETEFVAASGRPLDPKVIYGTNPCLKPQDVTDAIIYALGVPPHVQVYEVTVSPMGSLI